MTIPISFETEADFGFDGESLIRQVIAKVLEREGCPFQCQIDVLITDNAFMQEINREERGIDAPTDVLSFPMVSWKAPACFDGLEADMTLFHPESGELLLGDMVISVEKVLSQAAEYGHSPKRELAFLTVHSSLHLLGYDHEEDSERLVMEEKQEKLLKELGITRD